MRGLFIAFEGIDGSGITTHSKLLKDRLRSRKLDAIYTKEPSKEAIGTLIYELLMGFYPSLQRNEIYALLFAADRFHHLYIKLPGQPIHPEQGERGLRGVLHYVRDGSIVIMDRYKYSSIAYQTTSKEAAHGINLGDAGEDFVEAVNMYAPPPHILVYLDVDPETAYGRIRSRRGLQMFESAEDLERVKARFNDIILGRLMNTPEYCPGDNKPWLKKLRELVGVSAAELYPGGICYPVVIHVKETPEGKELEEELVSDAIYGAVLVAASEIGYRVDGAILREAEELYKQHDDIVKISIHRR